MVQVEKCYRKPVAHAHCAHFSSNALVSAKLDGRKFNFRGFSYLLFYQMTEELRAKVRAMLQTKSLEF